MDKWHRRGQTGFSISTLLYHTHTQRNAKIGFTLICPSVIVCNWSLGSPWHVSCLSIYHACFTLSTSGWENWFYIQWPSSIIWVESFCFCGGGIMGHSTEENESVKTTYHFFFFIIYSYHITYYFNTCSPWLNLNNHFLASPLTSTYTQMQVYTQSGNFKWLL